MLEGMPSFPRPSPWFRRFHPAPKGAATLVLLPHAGGSASFYHGMSALLAPWLEVICVQYPARQDRWQEPPAGGVREMADRVAEAVSAVAREPVMLFGHSMGALIAFETAIRLERGNGVSRLIVSAYRAPTRPRPFFPADGDSALIEEMVRLGGVEPGVLADPDLARLVLPGVRADYQALRGYEYRPPDRVGCPVTGLAGDQDPRASVEDLAAWAEVTAGDFELLRFPGGHFYLNDHLAEVARMIRTRAG
jgi:surfactin synthase thioesterase subunit